MKSTLTLIGFFLILSNLSVAQNVGIAEPAPNSKLDVVQTETTGNTLELTHGITTNTSSAGWIKNSGTGYGLHVQNLLGTSNTAVARFLQLGTGTSAHGAVINMDAATVLGATGLLIDQSGLGVGSYVSMANAGSTSSGYYVGHAGSGDGLTIFQTGTGMGIYNDVAAGYGVFNVLSSSSIGTINLMGAGGTGELIDVGTFDGAGVVVAAVDNVTTPTAGGDVFAFDGVVRTATPTGVFVNGGVLAGNQHGLGHALWLQHSGTSGRNSEFATTSGANTDATIFALHQGQGSVVLAQNQSNAITGTINVGDFSYTGTDLADHVGVQGSSTPSAGWGIGVVGQGGWYGVASLGDFTATGVKAFTIDHPQDPENKVLRHFSIESNEVLNLYRGMIILDGNGEATVELPTYFDEINTNVSYQLTAIGTPVQPYVLSEISGNTFEVAGEPNTKVSWTVYADRNDPYIQQNPEAKAVEVQKTGDRQGKYMNPELYGMPNSSAMFPKTETQTGSQRNPNVSQPALDNVRQKAANTQPVQMNQGNGPSEE